MSDNKDYNQLTLQELLIEEKKVKKKEILSAVLIGFAMGVIIYGVAKNGFGFLYIFIPLALIIIIQRNSQSLKQERKQIQAAINNKHTK